MIFTKNEGKYKFRKYVSKIDSSVIKISYFKIFLSS